MFAHFGVCPAAGAFVAYSQKSVFCIIALARERLHALQILLRHVASPVYLCAWLMGAFTCFTGASEVHRFSGTSSCSDDIWYIHLQVTRLGVFREVTVNTFRLCSSPFRDRTSCAVMVRPFQGFARCCAPSHIPPACGGLAKMI